MSFGVLVRLLPPSCHPRGPRSTKACQNHQKALLKHPELMKNAPSKNMPQEVQSHPLRCFCSGSSGLPRTSRNVADNSSLAFASPEPKKHGAAVNRRRPREVIAFGGRPHEVIGFGDLWGPSGTSGDHLGTLWGPSGKWVR